MNDTNPYAAPVPVEEDAPGYDLLKIARLYNRLGVVLKWFVPLLVVVVFLFLSEQFLDWLTFFDPGSVDQTVFLVFVTILKGMTLFILPVGVIVYLLFFYIIALVGCNISLMQYRIIAMTLLFIGACCYFGVNILVMILLRRRAAQILQVAGAEITRGRVDLANIPVEEDY